MSSRYTFIRNIVSYFLNLLSQFSQIKHSTDLKSANFRHEEALIGWWAVHGNVYRMLARPKDGTSKLCGKVKFWLPLTLRTRWLRSKLPFIITRIRALWALLKRIKKKQFYTQLRRKETNLSSFRRHLAHPCLLFKLFVLSHSLLKLCSCFYWLSCFPVSNVQCLWEFCETFINVSL